MTIGLQVDLHGIAEIERELVRLVERGHSLGQAHRKIGAVMESRVNQRFDLKRDPAGKAWAPHKASTRESYRGRDTNKRGKHQPRGSLLVRSGMMRESLGFVASADGVTIGFGRPYALYHEMGTRRMARRGLLMDDPVAGTLSQDDADAVLDVLFRHFAV